MLLTIDVGNTNIVVGIYVEEKLLQHWRISTSRQQTEDEYGVLLKNLFAYCDLDSVDISGAIISSVVPPLVPILADTCERYFSVKPIIVGPGVKTGLNILMDNPKEVGADRVVNAIAGYALYGGPLIIVDFGTATTFCAINDNGDYMGGAITPGLAISIEALFQKAAKLPRVEFIKPAKIIGKDTVSSMQSGIFYGFVGQVDGVVEKMKKGFPTKPKVIVTGGLGRLVAEECSSIDIHNEFLTLEGLRIIYQRNKK